MFVGHFGPLKGEEPFSLSLRLLAQELRSLKAKEEIIMLTQYYQETDVTVYWDSINNWIFVDWRNMPSKETVIRGCEEISKLLTSKKASFILNDNRQLTGTWVLASKWVAEEWFPRIIAAGLKKFAWVESPASTLSVISAKRSANLNKTGVIMLFKEISEAERWLMA